jgi:GMP synthase-like glutamine amidotransferase
MVLGGGLLTKLVKFDFNRVTQFQPNIVILEVGTNDLTPEKTETVGSRIDDLVRMLLGVPSVRVVGVCFGNQSGLFSKI